MRSQMHLTFSGGAKRMSLVSTHHIVGNRLQRKGTVRVTNGQEGEVDLRKAISLSFQTRFDEQTQSRGGAGR